MQATFLPSVCSLRKSYIIFSFAVRILCQMSSIHKMRMLKFLLIIILVSSLIALSALLKKLSLRASAAAKVSMAMPNCLETCGNFTIPYPFGMGNPKCYLNQWFEITCSNTSVPQPFLHKFNLEVLDFGFYFNGRAFRTGMVVNHPVYLTCRDGSSWNSTDLRGSPFIFSSRSNILMTVGRENILMTMNPSKELVKSCPSTCTVESRSSISCQTTTDLYFYGLRLTSATVNTSACTYAVLGSTDWFLTNFSSDPFAVKSKVHVPVFLDWGVPISDFPAGVDNKYHSAYTCGYQRVNYSYRCECKIYYEGNPYLVNGCREPTDVLFSYPNLATSSCANCNGDYKEHKIGGVDRTVVWEIYIFVLFVIFGMYKIIKRWQEQKLKKKFFKRNGGLLLQQQLSSNEDSFDTKIFTVKELKKATDNFNVSRVLGQGGQGTVYKGMLTDGMIVAVKKSTLVDERQVEQFINEVVILSQINHRNIVKLLGCCLETEVPLLVYEYISNGTLSQLIRSEEPEFPLSWEMRLQIVSEISGALTYLHSASSVPIYHRDIKSSNILLDDKYRAKVADFGTSRSVAIDQTHITTNVQGTFGYLDPEFFQSGQFTDKSDVYSFGVVLAELLTREKPIISRAGEDEIGLAAFFISALEKDSLFDIIDERVAREGGKDEIIALAILTKRCLNVNGRQRPTMKDVMFEIERIRMSHRPSNVQSISDSNRRVEDAYSATPFPEYTGNPAWSFHVSR